MLKIMEREARMRQEFPAMFNHPQARSNEIWIGNQIFEVAYQNASIYRTEGGLKSLRVSNEPVMVRIRVSSIGKIWEEKEVEGRSLFVDLQEYLAATESFERAHPEEVH